MKLSDLICSSSTASKIFSHFSPDFDLDACLENAFSADDPFGTLSQTLFDQLPPDLQTEDNQQNVDLFSEQLLLSVLTPPETAPTNEVTTEAPQEIGTTWDPVTNKRIASLDPRIQAPTTEFINKVEKEMGIKLRIAQGFRTFADQDKLYAQGRDKDKPGKKVTDAKGGHSYHNYGLAFDVVEIKNNGKINYNLDWKAVSQIAKDMGFEWGGDWHKKDKPHFQMTFGQTISDLLRSQQK